MTRDGATTAARVPQPRGDDGQIMLMTIGFVVVALLLVTAVVSASGIHLERKRLLALADLAALAAASSLDEDAYFSRADDEPVRLRDDEARDAVMDYLAEAAPGAGLGHVELVAATTDGLTATVTLRSLARPTLVSWVTAPWSDGIDLLVTASARAG
ncbi:pilus assembly protein TadG-related protein [Isoptericola sp. b441]|uniref:Pilus assembly protein TadG-related protein n=2 Tax=Actinotalea lenta TaxID=3064654 RepID=A0ABT9D882_9CELL|nr:pilus assembly protein TadG-related protein [Isoptericola sp. b441]MDO8107088.1 pilus assembly protein TadG-related protein [Isoptericola sp. b441]